MNIESRLAAVERQLRVHRAVVAALLAVLVEFVPVLVQAEQISGKACYRYSDNEALNAAREIALSLAKRDALEGYAVFVQSASTVENFALRNDLINNLAAGLLRKLRITDQTEDMQRRELFRSIIADVEPIEIKQQITTQLAVFQRRSAGPDPGLPTNYALEVLKVERTGQKIRAVVRCKFVMGTWFDTGRAAKPREVTIYHDYYVRMVVYDAGGIPDSSEQKLFRCMAPGQIEALVFTAPSDGLFQVELPQR